MKKFKFQTRAENELVEAALNFLNRKKRCVMTFKAPTGSGKTVMMANALASISRNCEGRHSLAILWIAPNQLHKQSYERLIQVYGESKALDCLLPEELMNGDLPEKSVLFMNWESIDSDDLVFRRDSERGYNLESYLESARTNMRKILLVADESHIRTNTGKQTKILIEEIIRPDLLIEISATPQQKLVDDTVTVYRESVVEAGLIRKQIVVNPDEQLEQENDELIIHYDGTSEGLLDLALEQQAALAALYASEGSPVYPLILVQLPSRKFDLNALGHFENYLGIKHGLRRGEGVEVWLSDDKTDGLEDIPKFSSSARVLFFKQGIATGWDCPRAQILVALREMKSETFTTQVLGRIIRHPEHRHYHNDALNYGYVFTNYDRIKLDAETATWMNKVLVRAKHVFSMPFPNWTNSHVDRRHHLNVHAIAAILNHKAEVMSVVHHGADSRIMAGSAIIEDIDASLEIVGGKKADLELEGLQEKLNEKKRELVKALADQATGRKYIEQALRSAAYSIVKTMDEKAILETILHSENWPSFERMVIFGLEEFKATQQKIAAHHKLRISWEAPETRFIDLSRKVEFQKSLYKPFLIGELEDSGSNVESPFADYLDACPNVDFWIKNGDSGKDNFAIRYLHNGEYRLFYIDFIVRLHCGKIALLETKGGSVSAQSTANMPETQSKAKALYNYINQLKLDGHAVMGGIVISRQGGWLIHDGNNYNGAGSIPSSSGWKPLEI